MSRRKRIALLGGGIPLGLILFIVAAWGIDTAVTGDRVVRNVTMGGESIGGLDESDLESLSLAFSSELSKTEATLIVDDTEIVTDPISLGVRVDTETLVDEALEAHRGGFFLFRPFKWVGTFFSEAELDVPYIVEDDAAEQAVGQLVEAQLDDAVEPILELSGSELVVVPGAEGLTVDPQQLIDGLPGMMAAGEPYEIELDGEPLTPELSTDDLNEVAAEANAATDAPVTIQVLASEAVIEPAQLRSWIVLDVEQSPPTWTIDDATAIAELKEALPILGSEDQQAHFDIVDNVPVIVPASESVVCCEAGSGDVLKDALLAETTPAEGEVRTATLEAITTSADDGVAQLEALGIIEEVATFTTNHSCCEGRVTNIHIMADYVRGAVIEPGGTFSLNGFVGRRTTERGFVPAGAIANGVIEAEVGGGVSQFATTTFNAAFFAGLEIPEYQSHSLYFSRYPRGREATISWPKPDLVLHNQTPYGVLIWTSYTDTSITVTMYSTKHMDVSDIGRTESAQGSCTRVTTSRQRIYDDGREEIDTVFAVYRPGEGLDCNGNSTVPTTPPTTTPDTTEPPSTEPDTTEPPVTEPPVTEPPVTEPPVTEDTTPDEGG